MKTGQDHINALVAIGKGYRYVTGTNHAGIGLAGPRALLPNEAEATPRQIEEYIARLAAEGISVEEIERRMDSRRADVASGYEDAWQ